jgi:parallel beta-helix repeat protein
MRNGRLTTTNAGSTNCRSSGNPGLPFPGRQLKLIAGVGVLLAALGLVGMRTGVGSPTRDRSVAAVPCSAAPVSPPQTLKGAGRTGAAMKAPSGSIRVVPGRIQEAVNLHGPNTSFLLAPGSYHDDPVTPKDGDRFYGEGKVVWDGRGTQVQAFNSARSKNVVVSGIHFTRFNPPNQGTGIFNLSTGESRFLIEGCEISNNRGTPVVVGNGTHVLNNSIHDNRWVGIGGYEVAAVKIDHNEIFNNYLADIPPDTATGDASGMKFAKTADVAVTNNVVRDNHGVGIWFDTDNIGTVIDGNVVAGNAYRGIMVEASYGAAISNNIITENGKLSGWIAGAGILISTASNVEVFRNVLGNNAQGIIGFQQDRGRGSRGEYVTRNNHIHDNFIAMADGITGFTSGAELDKTNRFSGNHYTLKRSAAFIWGNKTDVTGWLAAGQDKNGTIDCLSR